MMDSQVADPEFLVWDTSQSKPLANEIIIKSFTSIMSQIPKSLKLYREAKYNSHSTEHWNPSVYNVEG